jgi:ribosomal protein S18 acetylase RimI-like enzyme
MLEVHALNVRMADSADAEQIANLHTVSWQHGYKNMLSDDYLANHASTDHLNTWRERFTSENRHRYKTWLAYQNEVLAGFICVILDADDTWGTLIDNLHVRPDVKRSGIGRALMQNAFAWIAQNRPNSPLHLCVYEENNNARAFYDKLRGEVVERQLKLRADNRYNYSLVYVWHNPRHFSSSLDKV